MEEKNIYKEIISIPRYHCFMELFRSMKNMSSSPAILAPDRKPLLYQTLCRQIEYTTSFLNDHGLGRNDRIGVVVPSGPEMAVLFLSIIAGGTFVPLKPDYIDQEYDFCITHFRINALIVQNDSNSSLASISKKRGIPLIELTPLHDAEAGLFSLELIFGDKFRKCEPGFACPDDIALVLETSGTTSRPKIVALSQDNIFASAHYIKTSLQLRVEDRCLNIMPMYHITGFISPVLSTLSAGGSVICTSGFSTDKFFDWLKTLRPTWYSAVPAIHQAIIEKAEELSFDSIRTSLRFVRSTSSSLPKSLFEKLSAVFNCPVIQTYGLTEALPIASTPFPQYVGKAMTVGVPVSEVAIIDENGTMVGQGEIGEILVRGPQVFKGYEDNPAATEMVFFNEWFKTGDLGYLDNERYLYITGRLKEIINRGGQKVSPSEVEAVLISHPAVREATVFGVSHLRLGEAVVAAVVLNNSQTITERELRQYSTEKLAPFKVPQQIIIVEEIPKGHMGKFQKNKFSQNFSHLLKPAFKSPSTGTEIALAKIWQDVLGVDMVGRLDNFFAVGGDSLHGMQVLSLVKKRMRVALPAETIFQHTTLKEMADLIWQNQLSEGKNDRLSALLTEIELLTEEEAKNILFTKMKSNKQFPTERRISCLSPEKRSLLKRILREKGISLTPTQAALLRENRETGPVSFAQQRLWFLQQLDPASNLYNVPLAFRLQGELNKTVLTQSLQEIIRRHDVLRTTFSVQNGIPTQVIHPETPLKLRNIDLRCHPNHTREEEAKKLLLQESAKTFDLSRGPLVRALLIELNDRTCILFLMTHHIVFDAWSSGIFLRELSVIYKAFSNNTPLSLDPLPIQYADFAVWQRHLMQGDAMQEQLIYWKKQLDGAPPIFELPSDRLRPPLQTFCGARQSIKLPQTLSKALRELSRREEATLFVTLLAAFNTLLYRYTGNPDIIIGSPVANRTTVESESLIGFFVNNLVIRTNCSGNPSFRELLKRVRRATHGALNHQDLPFEKLVEEIRPERTLTHSPIFQIMFAFQNVPKSSISLPGLDISRIDIYNDTAKFDMILFMNDTEDGLRGILEFNTDLFEEQTVVRMLMHYQNLLSNIVADPLRKIEELDMLTKPELQKLRTEWNNNDTDYPRDRCIHALFEEQVERTPDAIAVIFECQRLTYRELNVRANQLAHYLRKLGVGSEVMVGVCVERSLEMVIGFLGILKAGGTYVPMDPAYPKERLAVMVEDTKVPIILTQQCLVDMLPANAPTITCLDTHEKKITQENKENPVSGATAVHLAYVMYTSGSTGRPKGVCVSHRAVIRLVANTNYISLEPSDIVAQVSNFSFDAVTFEIWGALLHGACLHIISKDVILSPDNFASQIQKQKISVLFMTTALFNLMARELPTAFRTVKYLLFGGEAADPVCVRKILEKGSPDRLLHMYGPTESTTFTTWYPVESVMENAPTVPIGRPVANTIVYILDKYLQPVPVGVEGELFIGGEGLALGYLNDSGLTEEKFVQNPFEKEQGARLYRTGDLARYLPDGNIQLVGRLDNQVKIRGFRIEPGEIETMLRQHPAVQDSIVIAGRDPTEGRQLIAYVLSGDNSSIAKYELRDFLLENLPEYMIPSRFVMLDSFPLTPNGKVDRNALSAMEDSLPEQKTTVVAPRNTLEKQLSDAWKKLLNLQDVGITENFFALGGHSLLAVQLMAEIKKVTGQQVPVLTLFQSPTIEQLADKIRRGEWAEQTSTPIKMNPCARKTPLFWVHDMFLAGYLQADQPLYVVHSLIPDEELVSQWTVEEMAAEHLNEIRSIQPKGPYILGGYCFWAVIALEMARQLMRQGDEVSFLFLVEPSLRLLPADCRPADSPLDTSLRGRFVHHSRKLASLKSKDKMTYFLQNFPYLFLYIKDKVLEKTKISLCNTYLFFRQPLPAALKVFYTYNCCARQTLTLYHPQPYPGRLVIFQAEKIPDGVQRDWSSIASGRMDIHTIPGTEHLTIVQESCVSVLSGQISKYLKQIQVKEHDQKT